MLSMRARAAPYRKTALVLFAAIGSVSAMLFLPLPSSSPIWPLAALLAVAANVGFGASVVAMNAYLPGLARESKDVAMAFRELQQAAADLSSDSPIIIDPELPSVDEVYGAAEPLLVPVDRAAPQNSTSSASPELVALREKHGMLLSQATSRISSFGIALGYAAGILLLIITLVPVTLLKGSTFALRLAIGCSGIWWAVFTIPALAWLPGVSVGTKIVDSGDWSLKTEIWKAWKRLGQMLMPAEIRKLRNTFWYLAAWFLLSDGKFIQLCSRGVSDTFPFERRFHHNYLDLNSFRKNVLANASIFSHPPGNPHTLSRHHRITSLASSSTSFRMVESHRACYPRHNGEPSPSLRLSWFPPFIQK